MESNVLSADAEKVVAWLRGDIATNGGRGRRLGKFKLGMPEFFDDEDRLIDAINELKAADLVHFENSMLGHYVCPNERS